MVQVQTYPPAYFPPPLSSSWHRQLPSSSSESQLLLKSTQILREMLAGAGSDLSPPEPGRDRELKRTPSGRLADVAFRSAQRRWDGSGVGMPAGTGAFCRAVRAPCTDSAPVGLSPRPQHPPAAVKQHRSGQGWSRARSGHRRERGAPSNLPDTPAKTQKWCWF